MRSATSYDTKLNPHEPSLSSCAWLCNQKALLPGAFFYYPTFNFQRAIKLLHDILPTWKASATCSSRRELSVAGLRSTGDLLVATQPLGKPLVRSTGPPTLGSARWLLVLHRVFLRLSSFQRVFLWPARA